LFTALKCWGKIRFWFGQLSGPVLKYRGGQIGVRKFLRFHFKKTGSQTHHDYPTILNKELAKVMLERRIYPRKRIGYSSGGKLQN
jgi:hypothetical protein